MTAKDLAVVIKGIAPVVREYAAAIVSGVEQRLAALEAKTLSPGKDGRDGDKGADGAPGDRGPEGPEGKPGRDGRDGLPGVPGTQGEKGFDGAPGQDGKDGKDGTLERLKVLYDGERTVTLCLKDGTPIDGGVLVFPVEIWRGVYAEGKTYQQCDSVTWAGSEWHCNEPTTTKPGDGSKAWTLKVKRGRDGKDGRDGVDAVRPVVTVGGRP